MSRKNRDRHTEGTGGRAPMGSGVPGRESANEAARAEHPIRFYARVREEAEGFTAWCESVDRSAWAATRDKAISELRESLRDSYCHVEAVAPPPDGKPPSIELVVLE